MTKKIESESAANASNVRNQKDGVPVIVLRDASALRDNPRNTRTHSEAQVADMARILVEFGFTSPVLVDGPDCCDIVAGHGRKLGALRAWADGAQLRFPGGGVIPQGQVPTLDVNGWSAEQRRAYVIADNQVALAAGWDDDLLRSELADLGNANFDLGLLGFGDDLLEMMGKPVHAGDPEELPPVPDNPVSQEGDVWVLGDHRLACGSSTDSATVTALLGDVVPHLMVTDPPYGVDYDPAWRGKAKRNDGSRTSLGVHAVGLVMNDDNADWSEAWALFPGEVAYVWHAGNKAHTVADSLIGAGFDIRAQIIWAKSNMVISRGHYHPKHEPCWYVVRRGGKGHWSGDRKQTTVWDIDKPQKSETGHSTQKPVECMLRPMLNNSRAGDAIYEPFSGSGTSIIAGEMSGRRVLAIELSPAYVDLAVLRWEQFAGGVATLEATGQTYAELHAERLPDAAPPIAPADERLTID